MPGTSGLLSPFGKMDGMYFDASNEPDDFFYQLNKDLEKIYDEKGIAYIKLNFDNKDDFYNALVQMQEFTSDNVRISGTSREGEYEIVLDKDIELDNDESDEVSESSDEE